MPQTPLAEYFLCDLMILETRQIHQHTYRKKDLEAIAFVLSVNSFHLLQTVTAFNRIMTILGANAGFETLMVQATRALLVLLGDIGQVFLFPLALPLTPPLTQVMLLILFHMQHLERGERSQEWGNPENWALLKLCKLDNTPVLSSPSPAAPVSATYEPTTNEHVGFAPTSHVLLTLPSTTLPSATTEISAPTKTFSDSGVPSPVPSSVSFGAAEHLTELKISMLQSRLKVEKLKEQMAKMQASLPTPESATSPDVEPVEAIVNSAPPVTTSVNVPATESASLKPETEKKKTPKEILDDLLQGQNIL